MTEVAYTISVKVKQIQDWLGHSTFSTTADINTHLDYSSKITSAQAMESSLMLPASDDFSSRWLDVTDEQNSQK